MLTAYNAANATDYEAVKSDMVVFANDGVASFEAGGLKSSPLAVTVNGSEELNPDRIYALPLSFTVSGIGILARCARSFTASIKSRDSSSDTKRITSPDSPQPKQW